MKKTHVIQDAETDLYFKETHPGTHEPTAELGQADFYTREEADTIAFVHYGAANIERACPFLITEGPASAYMAWLGRKSGKVMTPAKRKAQAKRARGRKSKKLHWTWSKNKPKSAPTS